MNQSILKFLTIRGGAFGLLLASHLPLAAATDLWIGTGRGGDSQGIYHSSFDETSGKISAAELAAEIVEPGFLAMSPDESVLYAAGNLGGKNSIVAYRISGEVGSRKLELINSTPVGDGGACHLCCHPSGKFIISVQYGGGSVAVFGLADDGSVGKRTQLIEHEGPSLVDAARQEAPHPHWTGFSQDGKFAFIPDLGLDEVVIYRVDAETSSLSAHGSLELHPGAGPRHMKLHPNGKWAYVLNELDMTVTSCSFDTEVGRLKATGKAAALTEEEKQKERYNNAAQICVHPSGRFVYSSNRGNDSITVFGVDELSGELSLIEKEHVRGATPRNFNLTSDGKWLLAAGRASHTIAAFQVDQKSGELKYSGDIISTPAPICLIFQD